MNNVGSKILLKPVHCLLKIFRCVLLSIVRLTLPHCKTSQLSLIKSSTSSFLKHLLSCFNERLYNTKAAMSDLKERKRQIYTAVDLLCVWGGGGVGKEAKGFTRKINSI